jgi:hypothetical protein
VENKGGWRGRGEIKGKKAPKKKYKEEKGLPFSFLLGGFSRKKC